MSIQITTLNAELDQRWNESEHRYNYQVVLKFGDVQIDAWPVPDGDLDRHSLDNQDTRDEYVQQLIAEKIADLFAHQHGPCRCGPAR